MLPEAGADLYVIGMLQEQLVRDLPDYVALHGGDAFVRRRNREQAFEQRHLFCPAGEAAELLGDLEVVEVKQASSFQSAECIPPTVAQEMIQASALKAIHRLKNGDVPKPFKIPEPVKCKIEFRMVEMADSAICLPGAIRLNGTVIEFVSPDMPTAYTSFRAAVGLA